MFPVINLITRYIFPAADGWNIVLLTGYIIQQYLIWCLRNTSIYGRIMPYVATIRNLGYRFVNVDIIVYYDGAGMNYVIT